MITHGVSNSWSLESFTAVIAKLLRKLTELTSSCEVRNFHIKKSRIIQEKPNVNKYYIYDAKFPSGCCHTVIRAYQQFSTQESQRGRKVDRDRGGKWDGGVLWLKHTQSYTTLLRNTIWRNAWKHGKKERQRGRRRYKEREEVEELQRFDTFGSLSLC